MQIPCQFFGVTIRLFVPNSARYGNSLSCAVLSLLSKSSHLIGEHSAVQCRRVYPYLVVHVT